MNPLIDNHTNRVIHYYFFLLAISRNGQAATDGWLQWRRFLLETPTFLPLLVVEWHGGKAGAVREVS